MRAVLQKVSEIMPGIPSGRHFKATGGIWMPISDSDLKCRPPPSPQAIINERSLIVWQVAQSGNFQKHSREGEMLRTWHLSYLDVGI